MEYYCTIENYNYYKKYAVDFLDDISDFVLADEFDGVEVVLEQL